MISLPAEKELLKVYSSNPEVEITYYPENGNYAIINNSNLEQKSDIYDITCNKHALVLQPNELRWVKL